MIPKISILDITLICKYFLKAFSLDFNVYINSKLNVIKDFYMHAEGGPNLCI